MSKNKQTKFITQDKGQEKAEKNPKPLSDIEDPEKRKLERLKRNYQPLTN